MSVKVRLEFVPPIQEDITKLHIYEAPDQTGPFVEIDVTDQIGEYPDYVDHYTTSNAASRDSWFGIAFEDANGFELEMSEPLKGGSQTLVNKIVQRVLQRDRSLDEGVVLQEAEAAIEKYLGEDPYQTDFTPTYRQLNGLTYIVLARSLLVRLISAGNINSVSVGLVSMKSGNDAGISDKAISRLVDLANAELGISTSVVLLLDEALNTYGQKRMLEIPWVVVP